MVTKILTDSHEDLQLALPGMWVDRQLHVCVGVCERVYFGVSVDKALCVCGCEWVSGCVWVYIDVSVGMYRCVRG